MAVTTSGDLYSPQALVGQIINDRATKLSTLLQTPAVEVPPGQEVWENGRGGDTIDIRTFTTNTTGFAQNAVRNSRSGVTPSKLSMGSYQESVENKTVSIDADGFAMTDAGFAEMADHLTEVGVESVSDAYQDSLILKAMGTSLELDLTTESTKTITVDSILLAKMLWGEKASAIMNPILFLHSKQFRDLAQTDDYKTLASAANNSVARAEMAGPIVATVHGVGIALLDSIRNSAEIPPISSITRSGAVATVTTDSAHGMLVGERVEISGATQTEYNGSVVIASVPSDTTFTFAVSGTPVTPATGSPVFVPGYTGLLCAPGALQLYQKLEPQVEVIPHAGSTVKTFDWHFRFATTLKRKKPRGVIRLTSR